MFYFDTAARQYDADFSLSQIGIVQRNQVYDFLNDYISIQKPLRILELNCGTGIDAFYFARAGHQVVATDASLSMINQCMSKLQIENINLKLSFLQCDISNLSQLKDNNFDLVFSNFSGFNCLNENDFANSIFQIQNKLNDNGKFIAVLFGTKSLMERIYFFFKFQFEKMNRREKYQSNFNGT
nr:class I SAM-dependent methyltransferase [Bacteroidota bacterium]